LLFDLLGGIPERLPVAVFSWCVVRQKYLRAHDLRRFVAIVFCSLVVFAEQAFASLIGSTGHGGLPFAPLSD